MLICGVIGVEDFFPGPYYAYYTDRSREQIEFAYERLMNFVESRGPFGGVIGFSQGGAFAAAAMIRHAILHPTADPLFKFGIFLCSTLPFNLSMPLDSVPNGSIDGSIGKSSGEADTTVKLNAVEGKQNLKQYDPKTDNERILVPTVHIIGRKDQYIGQCESLAELCSVDGNANRNMTSVYHELGHLVARDPTWVRKTAEVIKDKIVAVES